MEVGLDAIVHNAVAAKLNGHTESLVLAQMGAPLLDTLSSSVSEHIADTETVLTDQKMKR